MTAVSYVLSVHNDAERLGGTVARIVERLRDHPGSEVIVVENASSDRSPEVCAELAARYHQGPVKVVAATSGKGQGAAFRRGLELISGEYVCLTASDLPFGFTDLDQILAMDPLPPLVMGSKAHPQSQIEVPWMRRLMSQGFRALRILIVGLHARDSQGSIFLDGGMARRIRPHLHCDGFLIETEMVCWAVKFGAPPLEVPVVLPPSPRRSTVSPLRDSWIMARQLVQLRRRLHAYREPA